MKETLEDIIGVVCVFAIPFGLWIIMEVFK